MYYEYTTHGSVTNNIAYRLTPAGGTACDGDRIYVPSGTGTQLWPQGLYAWDADSSIIWGGKPYETGSPISTDIEYVNFGSEESVPDAEPIVIFGCEDGKIHVIRDGFDTQSRYYAPSGNDVWSYQLDSELSGKIDVLNYRDSKFNDKDYFVASTVNGTLYAFAGPLEEMNPVTGKLNFTQPSLLWIRNIANIALTSPTISQNREHVYVGTVAGILHGIDLLTGEPISGWNNNTYQVTDKYWSTSPVAIDVPPVIYASTSDGYVHAIWGDNGTMVHGWNHFVGGRVEPGLTIGRNIGEPDGGNLTGIEITPDGSVVMIGSDSGCVYSIAARNASVIFAFDTTFNGLETQCLAKPCYDSKYSRRLFVSAICLNNTPEDISDDFSIIYCLPSTSDDTQIWRLTLPGRIYSSPIAYINNEHVGTQADLILITNQIDENGNESIGTLYCFNTAARWIH